LLTDEEMELGLEGWQESFANPFVWDEDDEDDDDEDGDEEEDDE
jgi:hypothetical protein